jgi:putative ABC transport system substrate-binding protein
VKRREFMGLLGCAAATWPLTARAQQPMPVIGFLHPGSPETLASRLRLFHQGLKESGFVEGENVIIAYRWAEGRIERVPALAAELVQRGVALIIAAPSANEVAVAARQATNTIPVVFGVSDDPVKLGLVSSLSLNCRCSLGLGAISRFSGDARRNRRQAPIRD